MVEKTFDKHISAEFNRELNDLRSRVLAMGGLVEEQIQNAVASFRNRDSEAAVEVIRRDVEVNAMEVEIDEAVTHILACRQPTAVDLRMLIAIVKIITDLERIGDEAEKVAKMAVDLTSRGAFGNSKSPSGIDHLGSLVSRLLNKALDSFARLNVPDALNTACMDRDVDKEYEGLLRELITLMMEDPRKIGPALDVIWAARALERIGDHAKNICEYVIYLVEGRDVRHLTVEEIEAELKNGDH